MNESDVDNGTGDHQGHVDHCRMFSPTSILSVVMAGFLLTGGGMGCADMGGGKETGSSPPQSFSIYALSRGKGVPEEARKVLDKARAFLKMAREQGTVTRLTDQRIGLEGETRVCVELKDADSSSELFSHIQQMSLGVDLINVKIESCPQ
jgi:hypothetical protein